MGRAPENLTETIRRSVEPLGFELVGVEYMALGSRHVLRIYIDHAEGIDVDDCARVSHQVSGVLDVEDPIPGEYDLEVSSPGLDRPLFTEEHFARFAGADVNIRLHAKLQGRRRFGGRLLGVEDGEVLVEVDGETFRLPLANIEQARLVPQF
jgi:ribosome maturation factor RimP